MKIEKMSGETFEAVCGMAKRYAGRVVGYDDAGYLGIEFRHGLMDGVPFATTLNDLAHDEEATRAGITTWDGLRVEMRATENVTSLWQPVVLNVWRKVEV